MILTIDVGIKNLALCVLDYSDRKDFNTYKIKVWRVINILGEDPKCEGILKNGNICNKSCKYKSESNFYCKTHLPKDKKHTLHKNKKVKNFLLQDIVETILAKLELLTEECHDIFPNISKVLIELQPRVNQKMKFISHIIYTYFVGYYLKCNLKVTLRFIGAKTKLKDIPPISCSLKSPYSRRKYISKKHVEWLLNNKFSDEERTDWLPFFKSSKKADDLSDTMLYAVNDLVNNKK